MCTLVSVLEYLCTCVLVRPPSPTGSESPSASYGAAARQRRSPRAAPHAPDSRPSFSHSSVFPPLSQRVHARRPGFAVASLALPSSEGACRARATPRRPRSPRASWSLMGSVACSRAGAALTPLSPPFCRPPLALHSPSDGCCRPRLEQPRLLSAARGLCFHQGHRSERQNRCSLW